MNDTAKDALSRALKSLVAETPPIRDLAQQAAQGHRRRQTGIRAGVAAGAIVLAGAGLAAATTIGAGTQPPARSVTFGPAQTARSAITHDLSFDGGALKVAPVAGTPAVDEAGALSLFRSTGLPDQLVQNVSIGYGEVTLKPALAGGWQERAAWVVVYRGGPHGCPDMSGPSVKGTEGRHVFILDSMSGTDALSYQEAGPRCGTPSGPTVQVAQQYESLPWTQVSSTGQSLTIRYRDQDCTNGPALLTTLASAGQPQVEVIVGRPIKAGLCSAGAEHVADVELAQATGEPEHAPTGPVVGLYTGLQPKRFVAPASLT